MFDMIRTALVPWGETLIEVWLVVEGAVGVVKITGAGMIVEDVVLDKWIEHFRKVLKILLCLLFS